MRFIGLVLGVIVLGLLFGQPSQTRAQTADTAAVANAVRQAFLAGNLDLVFELISPDVLAIEPFGTFTNRTAYRAGVEGFLAAQPGFSATYDEPTIVLNTAVGRVFVSSDPIRALGISRIVGIETIVVQRGTIVVFTTLLDLTDPETARFAAASAGR